MEHVRSSKDLYEFYNDYWESRLDDSEQIIYNSPDSADARFLLTTKGKHRGYSTRVEQTGANGKAIAVDVAGQVTQQQLAEIARLTLEGAENFDANEAAKPEETPET